MLWSLNKDPADRPADADQFIMALEQVREAMAAPAGEVTASMTTIAAAAAVPAALMGAADAAAAYGDTAGAPYDETGAYGNGAAPDDTAKKRQKDDGSRYWPWLIALIALLVIAAGGVTAYLLTRPAKAVVPNVIDESQAVATTTLSNLGFTPNVINETSSLAAGTVFRQSPDPAAKVDAGATVTLTGLPGAGQRQRPVGHRNVPEGGREVDHGRRAEDREH